MQRQSRPQHRWFAALYDLGARLDSKRLDGLREMVCGEATGRVLEIGCGTGANLEFYPWARIQSLDATEPDIHMLKRARSKAGKLAPFAFDKLSLQEAPAEALPYPDATFETITSTLVLCSVQDLSAAIAEMRRVLKPDGQLRLLEHVAGAGWEAKVQQTVQPVYGWMAAGCQLNRDTEQALKDGGFEVEVKQRLRFGPLFPVMRLDATRSQ